MQYYIITDHAENGDLRRYLHENPKLSWRDRLYMVCDISFDLDRIHKAGFIHRDIHAGNILHTSKISHFENEVRVHNGVAYISDFGLSMAARHSHNTEEIYGVMPYITSEVLNEKNHSMESDVYIVGACEWENTICTHLS